MKRRAVFYANGIAVHFNPVEAAIRFSFGRPAFDGEEDGVKKAVRIHLPLPLAKLLARALTDAAARYEAEFGPLPDLASGACETCGFCPDPAARGETH